MSKDYVLSGLSVSVYLYYLLSTFQEILMAKTLFPIYQNIFRYESLKLHPNMFPLPRFGCSLGPFEKCQTQFPAWLTPKVGCNARLKLIHPDKVSQQAFGLWTKICFIFVWIQKLTTPAPALHDWFLPGKLLPAPGHTASV